MSKDELEYEYIYTKISLKRLQKIYNLACKYSGITGNSIEDEYKLLAEIANGDI